MYNFPRLRGIGFLLLILYWTNTYAQPTSPGTEQPDVLAAPTASAHVLTEAPTLDGRVLEDPVWQALPALSGFSQTQPIAGAPASERTEVRIGYTGQALYVGVMCFDVEPDRLVVSDARRDASLDETDSFRFILDTYHDGQNGFVFGTNPIGIEFDAQVDNEGQGNFGNARQSGGAVGGFNLNWDGSWEVRTQVTDQGWSAEFAIPFRTLRFAHGKDQVWGLNLQRNIRKRNEIVYWAPLPLEFNLNRLSMAGTLTGLDLKSPRNLKVIPYTLGQVSRNFEDGTDTDATGDVGMDLKYSLTPSLTLDLTYNTDFAQVEVDEQQINLDRFNLFFPEKRPFFLENAGLFTVGSPGEVELFFSRRIGIDSEDGQLTPILGGARLSGKVGRTNLGFLNMQTESVGETIQSNNFGVARVSHEFASRSAIGAVLVNRQGMGDLAPDNDYNRTLAVDGRLGLGRKAQLSGFLARTYAPEAGGAQHAFRTKAEYQWEGWLINAAYTEVAEGFNPEVGFLQRSAFRKPEGLIFYRYRPNGWMGLQELRPHVSYRSYWNFDGFQETSFLHIDNHWEFKNGYEIHTGVNLTTEGVVEAFEIADGVTVLDGTYDHAEAQIVGNTNRAAPISFNTFTTIGGFFGGSRRSTSNTLRLRWGDAFNSEFNWSYNNVDLPVGTFDTNLFRARLSYSFTPRIFAQGLLQYNDRADRWSTNLRFGWLQAANTGLFLVYNEVRDTDDFTNGTLNRSFIVKYSRLLDVLN